MTAHAAPRVGRPGRATRAVAGFLLLFPGSACDRIWPRGPDRTLPPIEDIREVYRENGLDADLSYNNNTVEIRVTQPADQLRRGGSLWARVGPWIYVFNPGTEQVFSTWPGISSVRVITRSGSQEVARAMLRNGALTEVLWRRSLNILGHAMQEGTNNPSRLQQLAEWGERYGEYEYSPEFVPRS